MIIYRSYLDKILFSPTLMADIAPTFGWICTHPWLLAMAEAMLDEEYEDPSIKPGHTNVYCLGRIGSLNVVINCLPEPPRTVDAVHMVQNMATRFSGIKAILITGFGGGVPSAGIRFEDLFISPATNRYDSDAESSSTPTTNIVQRAVYVL
jgi:nucleoside phosphorylase